MAVVAGFSLNIEESISKALGLILGPARLMITINKTVNPKDSPIAIRNGISYSPSLLRYAVYKIVSLPNQEGAYSMKKN